MKQILYPLLVLLACQTLGRAAVTPHSLFSENAVLQQQMNVPVWGTAKEGEKVTVEFQGQKLSTTTTAGRWQVVLKPLHAGGPFPLTISGENTITLTNIMVGEVWRRQRRNHCPGHRSGLAAVDRSKHYLQQTPARRGRDLGREPRGEYGIVFGSRVLLRA